MCSNAQKLSAIVARWLSPMTRDLVGMKLSSLPFLANLESKIKSTGWVGSGYSILNDLSPIMQPIINSMVSPAIMSLVKDIPDEVIPESAHGIVEAAMSNGGLSILEGAVCFSREDICRLKKLIDRNLPLPDGFVVEE